MSNDKGEQASIRFAEIWSLLWDRLGSQRLLFIVAMLIGMGEAIVMMIFPIISDIYFNQLELHNFEGIKQLLIICTALFFIITAITLLSEYLKQVTTSKLNMQITLELADHAQRLPLERAQGSHSSDLVQRITHDSKRITWLLSLVIDKMGNQALMFILAAIYMIWIEWRIAVVVLLVAPFILLLSHLLRSHLRKVGLEVAEQEAIVRQSQQDILQGMETIKAYGVGEWMKHRFVQERDTLNKLYLKRMWWQQAVHVGSSMLTHLIVFITLIIIAWMAIEGSMNLGALMAFFILIWRITSPLQNLASQWGEVQQILGSAVRTFALWRAEKEPMLDKPMKASIDERDILLQEISFSYQEDAGLQESDAQEEQQHHAKNERENVFISHLSLQIPAGSFIALVGPSGSGKSTIAKMVAGLLFPAEGAIYVGGNNTNENAELAREKIAYVPQSPYLFSGTIRENLLSVNSSVGEKEMFEATRIAQAHSFIEALPDGYETKLNEHGSSLSGGQKQRLAIARAILANRPILILDEATSALDFETERALMAELLDDVQVRNNTLVVVAHRLSTVKKADQIIVMENGKISQQGSHDDLLQKEDGIYHQMTEVG